METVEQLKRQILELWPHQAIMDVFCLRSTTMDEYEARLRVGELLMACIGDSEKDALDGLLEYARTVRTGEVFDELRTQLAQHDKQIAYLESKLQRVQAASQKAHAELKDARLALAESKRAFQDIVTTCVDDSLKRRALERWVHRNVGYIAYLQPDGAGASVEVAVLPDEMTNLRRLAAELRRVAREYEP